MTGQKLFLQEFKDNLTEEEKSNLTEGVSKAAMGKWKMLSKEEKSEYNEKAKEAENSDE
ncbi:hypothetical protein NUSPORA_02804 [Nucleospora cyclopteri]